jgi:hypothetical protein
MTKKLKQLVIKRQQAINLFCKECIGGEGNPGCGTWRQQVLDCRGLKCPLFPYRPLPRDADRQAAHAHLDAKYLRSDADEYQDKGDDENEA